MKGEGQGLISPMLRRRKLGLWGRKWFVQSTQLASLRIWPQIQVCVLFFPHHLIMPWAFLTTERWRSFILFFQEGFSSWHNLKLLKPVNRISKDWGVQGRRRLICQILWMTVWWLYPHNFRAKTREASCCLLSYLVSCESRRMNKTR